MPESAEPEPYPLDTVIDAVEQEYDDEPLRAEDLADAFELPIDDTRRLRAALYELYLRGELLRASDVDEDGARDTYHLAESYSG
jgi:hypothetical protein